jgi:EAL domain-containing protein (putative c-di-GMP-specific phosphodiesterase class I)
LENDLRKAIDLDQLSLVYQPIVSLQTGALSGVEALLRWEHPDYGAILPAEFIPVAEDTGLSVTLGEWVLRQGCAQMAAWKRRFLTAPGLISVNLSPKQFSQPALIETVRKVLGDTQLFPGALQLEVTEGACTLDVGSARQRMQAIKSLGVRLAMDDFGTGFSSLSSLHQFPVDVLKIDRSFVARVDEAKDIASLVHAAALLARNLGMATVAEGIERQSQVLALQELRCEYAQGYFFGKPMSAPELEQILHQGFPIRTEASGAMTFAPTWSAQMEFGSPGVGVM